MAGRRAWWPLLLAGLLLPAAPAGARGVYLSAQDFIAGAFPAGAPAARVLWLDRTLKPAVRRILGHDYRGLRLRYWRRGGRTAWILDEVGKERPITVGIVIAEGRVEAVRVLVFRESRGSEIRQGFFTRQFEGASLAAGQRLDREIDGISGATLSVRAMKKLVRLALYLHHRVMAQ